MLTDYIKKYKKAFTNDYIITNKIGGNRFGAFIYKKKFKSEHITYKTMQYQIKIFRNKYNLNDSYYTTKNNNKLHRVTLHTIRHNFLYRLYYTTKKDLLLTADIIGHQNIKVTSEYIRGFKRIKEEENVINTMAVI